MNPNRPKISLNRPAMAPIVTPEASSVPIRRPSAPEGDIVDRIFELLPDFLPPGVSLDEAKAAVREEWGGTAVQVHKTSPAERQKVREDIVRQVNEQFNGRNAAELARKLGIGRATVYRMLTRR